VSSLACFIIRHVQTFLSASLTLQFDWNVTRNENMADISGLQIAYRTWRLLQEGDAPDPRLPGLNLNTRQLFFLNAAQVNVRDESRNRRPASSILQSNILPYIYVGNAL
jgi:predicted metalloendopeptidase